jgi:hypothetical protein
MSYNQLKKTISIKEDSVCDICILPIKKGEEVYIIPGKYIAHVKCHHKASEYASS